jgi:hypothetical protein
MATSIVQSNSANTTTTPATVVLGAAPTAGNTLLAIMSSDTTSSAVPFAGAGNTFTQRLSQVNAQGFYVWTRLVAGGESATVTFTPNGANAACLMVLEIQGTYDKVGTGGTIVGTPATSVVATGLSPATTDGITIAIAGCHSITVAAMTGGAATAPFTFYRGQYAATSGGTLSGVVTARYVTSSTAATGSTTLSWSGGQPNDRDSLQIAFTGLAGGAPAIPPILIMQTRRAY